MSEEYDLFGLPRGRKGEPRKAGPGASPGSRPLGRPPRYGYGGTVKDKFLNTSTQIFTRLSFWKMQ